MRAVHVAALALAAVPVIALADHEDVQPERERCEVRRSDGDRVVRRGRLIVEAGERASDVVALQGDVVIRAGATVEDAIAIGGDVVVERGAIVRGSVVSVDGDVRVARDGRVDGDAFSLGGEVRVSGGAVVAGERGTLSATWGGTALSAAIASEVAEEVSCAELEEDGG